MKSVLLALTILAISLASPTDQDLQTAHLTFHTTDNETAYSLSVRANEKPVKTNNTAVISKIDAPDYLAFTFCHFKTPTEIQLNTTVAADGITQQVVIEPPTPVISVKCLGVCVPIEMECYDVYGQSKGLCCNGVCLANFCRPWNIGNSPLPRL